ncbi:hypothetical protein evm_009651 [Chilo suppressalis]|nr:hypothetical protein evm_009651 [Chilo suppressalis]
MSIYHWKLGDIALARVCHKVYAKVRVVKDEKGLFYDDKVLGISSNEDDSITTTEELCYYVEISRTKERIWLPYTSLHLAERSRPFYGKDSTEKVRVLKPIENKSPKKRKIKEDYTLPMNVKLSKLKEPDLNTNYDILHMPLKKGKYDNAFQEFVRRGKEMLFDNYFFCLQTAKNRDEDCLDYLLNVDASTEDKFEMVLRNVATEKEVENYLRQCWRYNFVQKQLDTKEMLDSLHTSPEKQAITMHAPWCLVCGKPDKLRECPKCPASFHLPCRKEWLVTILHRKKPPKQAPAQTFVKKILSSTRVISSVQKNKENVELCPSCMWGPKIGYEDVVWHKLGTCPWWPAKVLPPGAVPSCLLARKHSPRDWPLQYYVFTSIYCHRALFCCLLKYACILIYSTSILLVTMIS